MPRMPDREIVDGIARGDPGALAAAYDQYAGGLYGYCRSLVTEPAEAAGAVLHTFVIAAAKVPRLREPDRLRASLFAVARNECHRRQRARNLLVPLDEAAGMTGEVVEHGADAEQPELRALVRAALSGLNPGGREIIELNLRHELADDDLADVLGVPRNQVRLLASRARSQFEKSLGVLLVARSGPECCPDLAAILDGWAGKLTVLIRKRVNRHIDHCPVCGERKRRVLSPAMLLGLLPVATPPDGLREEALRLVSDVSPDAEAHRGRVVSHAEPFDGTGFPRQLTSPPLPRWQGSYVLAAVAAVAAMVLLAVGSSLVLAVRGEPSVTAAQAAAPGSGTDGSKGAGNGLRPVVGTAPTPVPQPGFPAAPLISRVPAGSSRPPAPASRPFTTPASGHSSTAASTSKSVTPALSTSPPSSAPAPSTSAPAPSTSAPAPSTSPPAPSTSAPAPSTSAPAPPTSAPAPATSAALVTNTVIGDLQGVTNGLLGP
jgi:RNA polymerase sigma factor (sigma-70 family)